MSVSDTRITVQRASSVEGVSSYLVQCMERVRSECIGYKDRRTTRIQRQQIVVLLGPVHGVRA